MPKPRTEICMPAYEPKEAHIRMAIESVLSQTAGDWTLLIQDDASIHEDIQAHIRPYLSDPRITFRRNARRLGIGGNWNACWRGGTSEFVAFLFHDDLWEPAYLACMTAALDAQPSAGFAAARHTYLAEGPIANLSFYEAVQNFTVQNVAPGLHERAPFLRWWMEHGLKPNVIGEPSFVLLRRTLMEEVGPFNETMVQFLDSEYWVRCLLRSDWLSVSENLGKFRVHPGGMSALNERLGRGLFERLQTLETLLHALPPDERAHARIALTDALSGMIAKYVARRRAGGAVSDQGSNELKHFCLKHPLLVMRAFIRWLSRR